MLPGAEEHGFGETMTFSLSKKTSRKVSGRQDKREGAGLRGPSKQPLLLGLRSCPRGQSLRVLHLQEPAPLSRQLAASITAFYPRLSLR